VNGHDEFNPQQNLSETPEPDDGWWKSILAEEQKYAGPERGLRRRAAAQEGRRRNPAASAVCRATVRRSSAACADTYLRGPP